MSLPQVAPIRAVLGRIGAIAHHIDVELEDLHVLLSGPEISGVSHARAQGELLRIAGLVKQLKTEAVTVPDVKGVGR